MLQLVTTLPGGLLSLPRPYPLGHEHGWERAQVVGQRRVRDWFALRERLEAQASAASSVTGHSITSSHRWVEGERVAREATKAAANSYRLLGAAVDEHARCFGAANADDRARLVDLCQRSHHLAHSIGEIHGGLYGCKARYDDGHWMEDCPVRLMHIPLGFSAGFSSRKVCSVCSKPLMTCAHVLGELYEVNMARDSTGRCSVCDERDCRHVVGELLTARAHARVVEADLHEVSLVPRPRDPRCRIESVEIDPATFVRRLGRMPAPEEEVWLHACMYPCRSSIRSVGAMSGS